MRATIQIPDELYRQLQAKSAAEGRPIRAVVEELFRRYLSEEGYLDASAADHPVAVGENQPVWFGALGRWADADKAHDMDSIRRSIAAGFGREGKP